MSFGLYCDDVTGDYIIMISLKFQEDLFTEGGRKSEMEEIRNVLDTGGRELPGTVFSVASSLLTFLAALAEPVVPVKLHTKCMEACNNTTLCKQVCGKRRREREREILYGSCYLFLSVFSDSSSNASSPQTSVCLPRDLHEISAQKLREKWTGCKVPW